MQKNDRYAVRVADPFEIDRVEVRDLEHSRVKRFDLWVKICHICNDNRTVLAGKKAIAGKAWLCKFGSSSAGNESVVPKLENQKRPKLFVMARFVRFVFADQPLNIIAVENSLRAKPVGGKHVMQQRI